jgi:hypothetical protein
VFGKQKFIQCIKSQRYRGSGKTWSNKEPKKRNMTRRMKRKRICTKRSGMKKRGDGEGRRKEEL